MHPPPREVAEARSLLPRSSLKSAIHGARRARGELALLAGGHGYIKERVTAGTEASKGARAVWLARLALLAVSMAACGGAAAVLVKSRRAAVTGPRAAFGCPMHPGVVADGPGACPICAMALEPRAGRAGKRGTELAAEAARDRPFASADGASVTLPGREARSHESATESMWPLDLAEQVFELPGLVGAGGDIEALLPRDEAAIVTAGGARVARLPVRGPEVELTAAAGSERGIGDTRGAPPDGKTWVHLRATGPAHAAADVEGELAGGTVVRVRYTLPRRHELAVNTGALLESPDGPFVLVASNDGRTFTVRHVQLGRVFPGFAVVLAGVAASEQVAPMGTFFLDAERRLRAGRAQLAATGATAAPSL